MKNPLPRLLPVSIDATAGSDALTTSSIEPGGAVAVLLDAAGAGPVNTMLPLTGATNTSDVCALLCGGPDSVGTGAPDVPTRACAAIGAGSFV
jgi:hypothetical protein